MRKWLEHPEASAELVEAAEWYLYFDSDLADGFYSEIKSAIQFINSWPSAAPAAGRPDAPFVRKSRLALSRTTSFISRAVTRSLSSLTHITAADLATGTPV